MTVFERKAANLRAQGYSGWEIAFILDAYREGLRKSQIHTLLRMYYMGTFPEDSIWEIIIPDPEERLEYKRIVRELLMPARICERP